MKVKQILLIIIFMCSILFFNTTTSHADLFLNEIDFDVEVNEDGSMDVTEIWDIEVYDTNTLYKTFDIDKEKYKSIKSFSVVEINGNIEKSFWETDTWAYHLPKGSFFGGINNDGKYEIAWGVSIDSTQTKKYKISYTVIDAIHKYNDCAELYWQFIGEDFEVDAEKITGTIKLPKKVKNKEELRVWGHTEFLNGTIYATSKDTVEFELDNYKNGYYVEVRVVTPTYVFENLEYTNKKDMLDNILSEEQEWAEKANQRRKMRKITLTIISIICIVITGVLGIVFTFRIKKKSRILKENPKKKPQVEYEYFRDLPDEKANPTEATFLLHKGVIPEVAKLFSATLLNLTLKKVIKMTQEEKEIKIEILQSENNQLDKDEEKLLDILKKSEKNGIITMKQVEKYIKNHPTAFTDYCKKTHSTAEKKAEEKEKYSKAQKDKQEKYTLGLVGFIFLLIMLMFFNGFQIDTALDYKLLTAIPVIIVSVYTFVIIVINIIQTAKLMERFHGFTQKGIEEQAKWKAFKKFMVEFSLLKEKEIPQLVLWEKYLVYATAFGVAEKVIKQLKISYPELNDAETLNNMVLFSTLSGPNGLNTGFLSSLNTSTSHMYSSTYSSGSGGGGGFSGGGGGGRRPEEAAVDVKPKK